MPSNRTIERFIVALCNGYKLPSWCGGTAGLVASFQKMSREHDAPTSIEISRSGGGFTCYARPVTIKLTEQKIILPIPPKYKPKAAWARERLAMMLEDLVDEMEMEKNAEEAKA